MNISLLLFMSLIPCYAAVTCNTCSGHASCKGDTCESKYCVLAITYLSKRYNNKFAIKTCANRLPAGIENGYCYRQMSNLASNTSSSFEICYCDLDRCNMETFQQYRSTPPFQTKRPQISCCTNEICDRKCMGNSCVRQTTTTGENQLTCGKGDNLISFAQNVIAAGPLSPKTLASKPFCYALKFHSSSNGLSPVAKSCSIQAENMNSLLKDPNEEIAIQNTNKLIRCHLSSPVTSNNQSQLVDKSRYEVCLSHYCGLLYEMQEVPHRRLNTRFCLNISEPHLIKPGCNELNGSWTYPISHFDNSGHVLYSRKLLCFCNEMFCNNDLTTIPYRIYKLYHRVSNSTNFTTISVEAAISQAITIAVWPVLLFILIIISNVFIFYVTFHLSQ